MFFYKIQIFPRNPCKEQEITVKLCKRVMFMGGSIWRREKSYMGLFA